MTIVPEATIRAHLHTHRQRSIIVLVQLLAELTLTRCVLVCCCQGTYRRVASTCQATRQTNATILNIIIVLSTGHNGHLTRLLLHSDGIETFHLVITVT